MLKQNNFKKEIHPNFNESHKNANNAWTRIFRRKNGKALQKCS